MGDVIKVKDIAEKCGCSVATVSKALNNSKELSQATIDLVNKVAKEMGYIPNGSARSLKQKRTYSIGILFVDNTSSGLQHEFFSMILDSVKVTCEKAGYDITFLKNDTRMTYLEHARYRGVDGVIIASVNFHDPQVVELVQSEVPTVTIDYVYNNATAIMSNNAEGMEQLVDFVLSKGHKRVAFIHGEGTEVTQKRIAGFYKSLKTHGIEVTQDMVIESDYHNPKAVGRITKNLMSSELKPTCIFYPDDISLLGGITALNQLGYQIPDDISVVGYDGISLSRYMRPMFTTYVQNTEEIGRLAASKLIERIENPLTFLAEVITVNGYVQEGATILEPKHW
ncbi:MAG: LacI family DNA-binding transcriptional regulator [Bacilli bacterium]|nr:LacI family DNA-binding transcriptional regulator [Bacilli bacterium]